MADPLETVQLLLLRRSLLLGVDMDHVARLFPLVAPHGLLGFKILVPAKPHGVHHPPEWEKGHFESLGIAGERATLVPQICCLLQLLPIERPQLAAPNTPLCWIALTEPRLLLVGSALADLGLRSKVFFARGAIIKMPEDQAFPTERCQVGIGLLYLESDLVRRAVTPGPSRPHTAWSAEQRAGTAHLDAIGLFAGTDASDLLRKAE